MRRGYSPRGARRGLRLAGMTAALWICWAVGYSQGISKTPAPTSTKAITSPAKVGCCLQRLDT
ncbi:MAG: hypothetical protein ACK5NY_05015 [Burkholderiaceae bacterium]